MGSRHIDKKCGDCKKWKPVTSFYQSNRGSRKRDGYCKVCRRRRDRLRSEQRAAAVLRMKAADPLYYRRKKLLRMYGITHEQYMEMHRQQGGVCAICRKPEKRILYGEVSHLVVDHDHRSKKVRSLLCCACNAALAPIEDPAFLAKATAYLESHRG